MSVFRAEVGHYTEAMYEGRSWTLNGGNVERQKLDTKQRQRRKSKVGH